jgi:1-acyl-sn-glycerol-3-phosphate acyltransferase
VRTPVLDVFRPGFHRLCRLYFGLKLRGTEHIPASGPLIITPNHQTFADPPLVTIPVRRPVHYMAWDRLFTIPLFGAFIRSLRAFPVDVEGRDSRAMRSAIRLLRGGHVLMIFPEGERSQTGDVGPFKVGAFRLAVSADASVLPVTISGAREAWPPGRLWPRRGRVTITYHPSVRAEVTLSPREAARELAARVRATVTSALVETADDAGGASSRRGRT